MTPRELLATARIPGGSEMKLYRRGPDHMILVDRNHAVSDSGHAAYVLSLRGRSETLDLFQYFIDERDDTQVEVADLGPVGQEPTILGGFPPLIEGGQAVSSRESDDVRSR